MLGKLYHGDCITGGRPASAGLAAAQVSPADRRSATHGHLVRATRSGRIDVRRPLHQPPAITRVNTSVYLPNTFVSTHRLVLRWCLHHLSRCPTFFQHRCIILGVGPLLRVIPHLAESNVSALSGGLIVAYAAHLLSDMLSKYKHPHFSNWPVLLFRPLHELAVDPIHSAKLPFFGSTHNQLW